MANVTDDKKLSTKKKIWRAAGLTVLGALAGLAIYDHRDTIVSCTKKSASWVKAKATGVANVFTKNK
jgi:hypothetical protein